jgi:hypothetical protein
MIISKLVSYFPFGFKLMCFCKCDIVGNKPEQNRDVNGYRIFSSSNQVFGNVTKSDTWNSDGFLIILKYSLTKTRVSEITFINDLRTCSSDGSTVAVKEVDSSRSKFWEVSNCRHL